MNNSNNEIGNNIIPTQQPNNQTGLNPNLGTNPLNIIPQAPQNNMAMPPANNQQPPLPTNLNIIPPQPQNNINPQPAVNPLPNNGITPNQISQAPQNINNNIEIPPQVTSEPNTTSNNQINNDEELLRAFIGNNYEKITTKQFNFAGFFLTTLYMFYRKMFGYAILVFLLEIIILNVVNNYAITLLFNIAIGLLINKLYISYAQAKIDSIKTANQDKSIEEIKNICATKGGTSIGKAFLGFITELAIGLVVILVMALIGIGGAFGKLINLDNFNIISSNENQFDSGDITSTTSGTLLENVSVAGYSCLDTKCNITIENENGDMEDYSLNINNSELFKKLGDYKDNVKLNIYYSKKGNQKTIVNYKLYLKSTDEDISNIKTENELRDKLGLYSTGTHTDTLTLKETGLTGFGSTDDKSYSYIEYTFTDSNNNEYKMKYIIDKESPKLTEGKQYSVTFEVTEGDFEYEFTIKSIK